jgi:hypothetical protein
MNFVPPNQDNTNKNNHTSTLTTSTTSTSSSSSSPPSPPPSAPFPRRRLHAPALLAPDTRDTIDWAATFYLNL